MKLLVPFVWVASTLLVCPFRVSMLAWLAAAALTALMLTPHLGRIGLEKLMAMGALSGGLACSYSILKEGPEVVCAGMLVGALVAAPLAPVVGAAEWVRARPRSLLDGVGRRCALIVAALTSIIFVDWGRLMERPMPHAHAALALNGFLVAACAAMDAWRLLRLSQWRRDLGVGEATPTFVNEGSPYRTEPRVISVVYGDLGATRRILMRQITVDVAALLFALAGITAGLTT